MKQKLGYLYSSLFFFIDTLFLISGITVLFNVPEKLKRIDLQALNSDCEIAFILLNIYWLMVGIGIASLIMQLISGLWVYPALLTTTIIGSFIVFRKEKIKISR